MGGICILACSREGNGLPGAASRDAASRAEVAAQAMHLTTR